MLNSRSSLLIAAAMISGMSVMSGTSAQVDYPIPRKYSPGSGNRSRRRAKPQAGDKLARKAAEGKLGIWV